MTPQERALLEQVALDVRQEVVELNDKLFHTWFEDLGGACAVASMLLHRRFRALGFKSRFVLNRTENHCFVLVDSVIFDITATQFGSTYPELLAGTRKEIARTCEQGDSWLWKAKCTYVREESISRALQDWPEDQQPVELKKQGLI